MTDSSSDAFTTAAGQVIGATPEHRALTVLVGRWRTTGEFVDAVAGSPPLRASDTYEWLPGGHFLLHRAEGDVGGTPFATLEVFGYDRAAGHHFSYAFGDQGTVGRYTAMFEGRAWRIDGEAERFRGEFSADGRALGGLWERRADDGSWRPWLRITLTKEP